MLITQIDFWLKTRRCFKPKIIYKSFNLKIIKMSHISWCIIFKIQSELMKIINMKEFLVQNVHLLQHSGESSIVNHILIHIKTSSRNCTNRIIVTVR